MSSMKNNFETEQGSTPNASHPKSMKSVLEETQIEFPSCKNFIDGELEIKELTHAICCVSMHLKHNTGMEYINGRKPVFYCKSCSFYKPRKSKVKCGDVNRAPSECCPFFLRFVKRSLAFK